MNAQTISTGSLALDLALGGGGIPRGGVTVLYGGEGAGKTTLAALIAAEAQKAGRVAAWIDAEHSVDAKYASALGIDIDSLLVSSPATAEEALEVLETLVRSGGIDVVVLDSIAALLPRAESDGRMGDDHRGESANLISRALRRINSALLKTGAAAVLTNQIREKVGVPYGNPEVTPGGRALKFYASVLLEIRCIETFTRVSGLSGNRVKVKVVKNKSVPPGREAEFEIIFGKGICRAGSLLDIGVERGLIAQNGDSRESARRSLEENPALMNELEAAIRNCRA